MRHTFVKQTEQPLFPKVFWEKPVNKRSAKQLLIIGGHASEFSATQMAYQEAKAAGIGEAKVVLPDSVLKLTGNRPDCMFVASTPSGSIAKAALPEIETYVQESDGLLLAGELSENAETVSVVETLARDCQKPLVFTQHAIGLLLHAPELINSKPNRLLAANTQTFLKLADAHKLEVRIQSGQNLLSKVDLLSNLQSALGLDLVLSGPETIVASGGEVSVTGTATANAFGDGLLSTFWLQHPNKFQALTAAAYVLAHAKNVEQIMPVLSKLTN